MKQDTKKEGNGWYGRSLDNYKSMHAGTAKDKGLEKELREAKTLTQARKILFGLKRSNAR